MATPERLFSDSLSLRQVLPIAWEAGLPEDAWMQVALVSRETYAVLERMWL